MGKISEIRNCPAAFRDNHTVWQTCEQIRALADIPVEDLAKVQFYNQSGQIMLIAAMDMLKSKLIELEAYRRAQRFTQDLVENGRPRNG